MSKIHIHVLAATAPASNKSEGEGRRVLIMHGRGRVDPVHHGRPREYCDCASVDTDDIDFVCGICAKF